MADFKRASLALLTASVVPIAALPAASATLPQKIISVPLIRDTELTAYFGEFQIGTPPQKELVKLDTGSPYYGFLNPRNSACTSDPNACTTFGTFDNLTSSYVIMLVFITNFLTASIVLVSTIGLDLTML